ncbi:MAG: nucleotide sugar dehydrogenase [Candidatus Peribacteraceae bacterium]|nr:nucleotide sugar dehydrogenase [Candidatus Peribacteraceae bacterium]
MQKPAICVVGLGYVGLPLAHAFAKKGHAVSGYDISKHRVQELSEGKDSTLELSAEQLWEVPITFSTDPAVIGGADVIIMALPTPIDDANNPDMTILFAASATVGKHLKKGAIVVYESTVYPGVTEELCGPILEKHSGLVCGKDFTLGYSPERINPGDKQHTVTKILKIVAGQDAQTLDRLADLYGSVIEAGVHRAPSIRVAEMAKAIENAQRDINIAFVNEVAMLCNRLNIPTKDVLEAAGTKWNFLKFTPGLVGGHCIGVDPYYLVEKAKQLGMATHVITAGRAINDGMSAFVAGMVAGKAKKGGRVLVLGLTFKEDIPDTRNSKAQDVVRELRNLGFAVEAHDPFLPADRIAALGMTPGSPDKGPFDAILLLVPHREYRERKPETFVRALNADGVFFDLKTLLPSAPFTAAGKTYLSL